MKKQFWIITVVVLLVLFLRSISLQPLLLPRNQGIPDREIVFVYWNDRGGDVGFINPDGSGFEFRDVKVPTGLFDYGFPLKRYIGWLHDSIRWSENGDAIGLQYFRYAPTGGIPFLIDLNGEFTMCPVESLPYGMYGTEGIEFVGQGKIISVNRRDREEEVILYDMQKCQQVEVIYEAKEGESLYDARISKKDWIALWHSNDNQPQITILSSDKTVQAVIEDARDPAWSRDGEQLAFVKSDGLYIATKDGKNIERVLEASYIDCPAWSPDGDKLVMEYPDATISVLDLTSGEVTKIVEDGYCPDWR